MHATGLFDTIGQDKVFATEELAIAAIYEQLARVARMIFIRSKQRAEGVRVVLLYRCIGL